MFKETKLLQASLAGDKDAFEAIVEKYQATVCAITFSGTGRCDVSEELAQETFLNAWWNLHQLRDLKGFRSWLYSIARNALRNYYRQNKVVREEADPTELAARESDGPPEILIHEEERVMLEQAILRLPEKYREPLVMFCRQGHSVRESADALGLSEATVRTRLHRARNLLKEDMAKRLEHVLEQTGPRKDFTKAVMVAVATVPIGLASTAKAATSAAAGQTAVTGGVSAVLSSVGVKIAAVATAIVVVGALVHASRNNETPPAVPAGDVQVRIVSSEASPPESSPATSMTEDGVSVTPPVRPPAETDSDLKQASLSTPPAKGSEQVVAASFLTGTVLDRNTRHPIVGARVGFEHGEAVATDAQGCFRLPRQDGSDEVWMRVVASGYASKRVVLRIDGAKQPDMSFRLQPGLALAGTVVDPNREPIANATVQVMSSVFACPPVITDDRGEFRIDGLNPENALVYVVAEHVDYVPESAVVIQSGRLGEPTRTTFVLSLRSSVESQGDSETRLTRSENGAGQVDRARVYGHVVDAETGEPLDCFGVVRGNVRSAVPLRTDSSYTFVSAAGDFDTGRWHFASGQSKPITVCAAGYDPLTLEAVPSYATPGDSDRMVFRLQRNERRSTIYVGRVVDDEGRPIPGAEIGFRVEEHMSDRGFARVATDEAGVYMLSSVDPHEQIVFVRAGGYASHYCRMSDLLLDTAGVLSDVVLSPPATVSGYVWDEMGQPVAHTTVVSSPATQSGEDALLALQFQDMLWPSTRTDDAGYYQLSCPPLGEIRIEVRFKDNRRMPSKRVTLASGEAIELHLGNQGGFVISGVVADGGTLLEWVEVQLDPTDEKRKPHGGRTDAAGRFKIIGVPKGEYVFATLIPPEVRNAPVQDPGDLSHILNEVMDIQRDLELKIDYQTRSIATEID